MNKYHQNGGTLANIWTEQSYLQTMTYIFVCLIDWLIDSYYIYVIRPYSG